MTYEQMKNIMKLKMIFQNQSINKFDFGLLFNCLISNNDTPNFYFSDLMITSCLFTNSTFNQKMEMFYELLILMEGREDNKLCIHAFKGFIKYIYDTFMVYLPHNQLFQLVDRLIQERNNCILKADITFRDFQHITLDITKELNILSQFNHLASGIQDIYLGDSDNLTTIKIYLEEKLNNFLEEYQINPSTYTLKIRFKTNFLIQKYEVLLDNNWSVLKRIVLDKRPDLPYDKPNKFKPIQKVLHNNENLISLTSHGLTINKQQFISIMHQLPLLQYLFCFENTTYSIQQFLRQMNLPLQQRKQSLKDPFQFQFIIQEDEKVIARFNVTDKGQQCENIQEAIQKKKDLYEQIADANMHQKKQTSRDQDKNNKQMTLDDKYVFQADKKLSFMESLQNTNLILYNDLFEAVLESTKDSESKYRYLVSSLFENILSEIRIENVTQDIQNIQNKSLVDLQYLYEDSKSFLIISLIYNKKNSRLVSQQEELTVNYDQLGLFYFSDFSKDWLPCIILKKVFSKKKENKLSYYIVKFKHFPSNVFKKKPSQIIIQKDFTLKQEDIIQEEISAISHFETKSNLQVQ